MQMTLPDVCLITPRTLLAGMNETDRRKKKCAPRFHSEPPVSPASFSTMLSSVSFLLKVNVKMMAPQRTHVFFFTYCDLCIEDRLKKKRQNIFTVTFSYSFY